MRNKRDSQGDGNTCPLWMMTFGDCMSLLVTFFVMLIAFTNTETQQLLEMLGGLRGALGITPSSQPVAIIDPTATRMGGLSAREEWLSLEELSALIPDARMAVKRFGRPRVGDTHRHLIVQMLEEGMVFIISATPLFGQGEAVLLTGNDEMLHQIGAFAARFENEVQIIGVVPESTAVRGPGLKSPRGLAIARTMAVREALCRMPLLSPDRFSVGSKAGDVTGGSPGEEPLFAQRIEIVIVGRRVFEDMSAEEIVVKDKWR